MVLDTAPTGHTILLLDAAEAYHRDVTRTMSDVPDSVRQFLPRLRDPKFTRVLLVTLPEATPVHEAARLQDDLQRAGMKPYAWVINQSFAGDGFRDPVLVERGSREAPYIAEVRDRLAHPIRGDPLEIRCSRRPPAIEGTGERFTGLCRSFERLKTDMDTPTSPRLSFLDRYLTLWILPPWQLASASGTSSLASCRFSTVSASARHPSRSPSG